MEQNGIFNSKNIITAILIAILVMIIALAISLFETPKYKAGAKLLVVVNQENIDSYTATRTAGYVSDILSEVAYSGSFVSAVLKSDYNVNDDLGSTIEEREKNWKKTVNIKNQEDKGIIVINVFHRDHDQADKLAQAITYTLSSKHQLYHGLGDRIAVKVIDTPAVSEKWVQPKIFKNSFLGLLIGLVIGLTFIVVFPDQRVLEVLGRKNKSPYHEPADWEFTPAKEETAPIAAYESPDKQSLENETPDTDQINPDQPRTDGNRYYNW